jgi:hypothetical protein
MDLQSREGRLLVTAVKRIIYTQHLIAKAFNEGKKVTDDKVVSVLGFHLDCTKEEAVELLRTAMERYPTLQGRVEVTYKALSQPKE